MKRTKEASNENEDYYRTERESQNQNIYQPGLHPTKSAFHLEKVHFTLPTVEGTLKPDKASNRLLHLQLLKLENKDTWHEQEMVGIILHKKHKKIRIVLKTNHETGKLKHNTPAWIK